MIDGSLEGIKESLKLFANSKRKNYFNSYSKEEIWEEGKSCKTAILCDGKNKNYPNDFLIASNLDEAINQLAQKLNLTRDNIIQNYNFAKFFLTE